MTDPDPAQRADGAQQVRASNGSDDLDRLVARSLAASERGSRAAAAEPVPSRAPWPWLLAAFLLALLLGILANPWFERQMRSTMPAAWQESDRPQPALPADLSPVLDRMAALEAALARAEAERRFAATATPDAADAAMAQPQPGGPAGLDGRLVALESAVVRAQAADAAMAERLDRLVVDVASIAGGSTAQQDQVRDLLLATAARRLFDRGRSLEPLMPAIRQRLDGLDPDAVEALDAWNGAPVTRQSLMARLDPTDRIGTATPPVDGWWSALKRRLSAVVQVREASNGPDSQTLAAARSALAAGDLDRAIALMAAAPANPDGVSWINDARRLSTAELVLDRMELAMMDGMVRHLVVPPPAVPGPSPVANEAVPSR